MKNVVINKISMQQDESILGDWSMPNKAEKMTSQHKSSKRRVGAERGERSHNALTVGWVGWKVTREQELGTGWHEPRRELAGCPRQAQLVHLVMAGDWHWSNEPALCVTKCKH